MPEPVKDIRGMPERFSATPKVQWPFIMTADGPKSLVPQPEPTVPAEDA